MKNRIAALGALAAGLLAGCATVAEPARPGMKFGVVAPLSEAAELKEIGYDFIECTVNEVAQPGADDATWRAAAEKAKASPLPIRSLVCLLPGDERLTGPNPTHDHALAWAETACRRADALGIPYVVLGSGGARRVPEGFDPAEGRRQFAAFAKKLAARIAGLKTTVVVEPLNSAETNLMNRESEGVALVDEVASPRVRLLADFYHMVREGEGASSVWIAGGRIRHVHVADPARRGPPADAAALGPYFRALREAGYAGGVSCECGWPGEPAARRAARAETLALLKALAR